MNEYIIDGGAPIVGRIKASGNKNAALPCIAAVVLTDVANAEQLLRIIQSVPSPKAELFKMWLARAGRERIDETV